MAPSSILPLISRKVAAGSSKWISRKATVGSSISISRKAAAGTANLSGSCGARINTMSVSHESVLRPSSLPSTISPWLMLPPTFEGGDMVYKFYSLAENKVLSFNKRGGGGGGGGGEEENLELPDDDAELVGSSHGWLVLFNRRNCDMFLSNPLSRRHIKLPPIHTLRRISKVIISCSPDEEECRAMIISGHADRLAFCLPGRSTEWTPIGALFHKDTKFGRFYEDFVYSSRQKLFISLTEFHREFGWYLGDLRSPEFDVEGWDLQDPRCPRINWKEDGLILDSENCTWSEENMKPLGQCREMQYLVFSEDSNELFIVIRYVRSNKDDSSPYKTIGFDVLKVDREGGKLRYTTNGPVMFVGTNHSFAISAVDEFPELKPNSIYFTDPKELIPPVWPIYDGHDIGIFNYENRTFSPCYENGIFSPCVKRYVNAPPPLPVWFTPSPH